MEIAECKVSTEWDNGTRKRKLFKQTCARCSNDFWVPKHRILASKFCGRQCANAADPQDRITIQCHHCGCDVVRLASRLKNAKHGFHFCSRKCKEVAQSLNGNCDAIRPDHYGTSDGSRTYRQFINTRCVDCPEARRYLLLVHHIDGDRSHNDPSNLETVCATCHMRRHLRQTDNGWMFCTSSLTPRDLLHMV